MATVPAWMATRFPPICEPRVNHHIREQAYVVTNLAISPNVIAAHEHRARAELHARANDATRPDVRGIINLRRGRNVRARMNALRRFIRRKKDRQQSRDSDAGVGYRG